MTSTARGRLTRNAGMTRNAEVGSGGRLRTFGGLAAGVVTWLAIGGVPGIIAALIAAPVAARLLRRVEPASVRRQRRAAGAELPYAVDLLAAALRAGVPVEMAVRTTAVACGGIAGRELLRVADGLRLGLEPGDAWRSLRAIPGGDGVADVAVRSADSGAAVARALERLAEDLRSARTLRVDAAAQRIGVLIVLPLGVCFLPAFVLAGIVPVIVAVLGGVLR
ncbi:MAG TPA: type II secretion system F family protein [Micromonosporaceae bacterium]|nr:type II secretion system F family protein [Micromonosporaceae bacterium]